jgi:hypothetical protein
MATGEHISEWFGQFLWTSFLSHLKDRSKFSKHSASPTCQLCKSEPEDRLHFLVKCKALEEIRTPLINKLRCYLIDIIRPNLIQELLDNSDNLLQLIIDSSSKHTILILKRCTIKNLKSLKSAVKKCCKKVLYMTNHYKTTRLYSPE